MHDNPLVPIGERGNPPPPTLPKRALFHWDDAKGGRLEEGPHALSPPVFLSSFQATRQPSTLRIRPYWTADEIGLVTSGVLGKMAWEQEATRLTFALNPTLLASLAAEGLCRVTGELGWTLCQEQPVSFTLSLHPILLIHSLHPPCPAECVEIVPHLREQDPLLQHIALVLQTHLERKGTTERFYVESLVDALAVHFLRRFGATCHPLPQGQGGPALSKLRRTLAYIKAHLAQELSLGTLAAVEKTSPAHFARLFKSATGLAPHQYVISCRIKEAKRLLGETEEALIEIGLRVGCADQSHFTALFHKHVGLTPKAYRDSLRS